MTLFVRNLVSIIGGVAKGEADFEIKTLLFDSRRLNVAQGTLFFAITTPNNDGRKFIADLYARGVRCFVLQEPFDTTGFDLATFIFVPNTIRALQDIAKAKRNSLKQTPVAAITGSNGKTVVKDWIVQLIGEDKNLCYTPKSYNSQIGVPISVWNMSKDNDLCIFEVGISKIGEMEALEQIIQPSIGILTTLTDAHQANFPSMESKLEQKLKLFSHCQSLILCSDLFDLDFIKQHLPNVNLILWSQSDELSKQIAKLLPFNDKSSVQNAINAYHFAKLAGINEQNLQQRLKTLRPLQQRLEVKSAIGGSILIDDTYSSDFMSLEIALDFLNQQSKSLTPIVILSEIEQSSLNEEDIVIKIDSMLANKHITKLYAIGKSFVSHSNLLNVENETFDDVNDFITRCNIKSFSQKAILIKGSRATALERISRFLEEKTLETRLEINLSALTDNVRYFRSLLCPKTKLMAMVKAQSYGVGGWEVASALTNASIVDYLSVAYCDEGVELRNKGINLPIMVNNPQPESLERLINFNLEPEVYSIHLLKTIIQLAEKPLDIHLKLDTGMHRLGLERQDLETAIQLIKSSEYIKIKSIFSHLFGADNPSLDALTLNQIAVFEQNSKIIEDNFDYKIMKHLANSAGLVRFPQAHYDMVRLGIGMYGIGTDNQTNQHLKRTHKLSTTLTQIRKIKKGDGVGYNHNFIAKEDMLVGVIPIGYADGLSRRLGNSRFQVLINGCQCEILGNVCMDMAMVNLNSVQATEGTEVVIFAPDYPVEQMADAMETIPYEVFTSISQRVKRIYYYE
ncbi:MAG: bifunctional UDP-N-acetylmuramoyl-tripeptide:D-alanyl-D-alanine ligase/alanine racemase [Bacteroidales bacterium]|jgi:alanine racemase|nr:bifunctional UDP-N-acetylmuramoyl-tripeptide:D-alanyl-D-alanine ligase/alanine racemase [Bacteroidales bacterium]